MIVEDAITFIRRRLNDLIFQVYTNDEIVGYINEGIQATALDLIRAGDPLMVNTVSLTTLYSNALPSDFHSLLPGQPIRITDGTISVDSGYSGSLPYVRYFKVLPNVTYGDTIPLREPHCHIALNTAVEIALMRTGHDVSQERDLHLMMRGGGGK